MARPPEHGHHVHFEQEMDLTSAIDTIAETIALLKKDGELKVTQHGQQHVAKPTGNVAYVFEFKSLPKGDLALKFEVKWMPGAADTPPPRSAPFKIEGLP